MRRPERGERSAFDDAVRILARRSHGRVELSRKLRQRGHEADEIERAFARLAELGYLEPEAEVAERYARELARAAGATPRAVGHKLRQRGFEETDTDRALALVFEDWDAEAAALEFVRGEANRDRAARRLARRGFDAEVVVRVLRRLERD